MVDAIPTTELSQIATEKRSELDKAKFSDDLDDFLKLLVTQLQNQDPTEPMDTTQFTDQIFQLSTVEQSINQNNNLEELIQIFGNSQNGYIVSYVGKLVEVEGTRVELAEQGATRFAYELPEGANAAFVQIFDDRGNTVFLGEGPTKTGRNSVTWDGLNADGERANPGNYNVKVSIQDSEGNLQEISTFVGGRVEGLNLNEEPPTLLVNGEEIPLDSVNFIGEPVS